jgi:Toluene-4-monooxygenase system protein B (TmoB)
MLIPVFGFLKGDTIGLVVLVHDTDRIKDLAISLQEAAAVRVAPSEQVIVYAQGVSLDPELTIAQAGITALDRVDVVKVDA